MEHKKKLQEMSKKELVLAYEKLMNEKDASEVYLERKINRLKKEDLRMTEAYENLVKEHKKKDLQISELHQELQKEKEKNKELNEKWNKLYDDNENDRADFFEKIEALENENTDLLNIVQDGGKRLKKCKKKLKKYINKEYTPQSMFSQNSGNVINGNGNKHNRQIIKNIQGTEKQFYFKVKKQNAYFQS